MLLVGFGDIHDGIGLPDSGPRGSIDAHEVYIRLTLLLLGTYLIVGNWKFQSYSGFEPGYEYLADKVIGVAAATAGVSMALRFTLYFTSSMCSTIKKHKARPSLCFFLRRIRCRIGHSIGSGKIMDYHMYIH